MSIYIIERDEILAGCIKNALQRSPGNSESPEGPNGPSPNGPGSPEGPNGPKSSNDPKVFPDIYSAWDAIQDNVPSLIFLDLLPTGPDGFTLLNQLASLPETENIPIVLLSAIDLTPYDLSDYNIKRILNKETFTPMDIADCTRKYYDKQ